MTNIKNIVINLEHFLFFYFFLIKPSKSSILYIFAFVVHSNHIAPLYILYIHIIYYIYIITPLLHLFVNTMIKYYFISLSIYLIYFAGSLAIAGLLTVSHHYDRINPFKHDKSRFSLLGFILNDQLIVHYAWSLLRFLWRLYMYVSVNI